MQINNSSSRRQLTNVEKTVALALLDSGLSTVGYLARMTNLNEKAVKKALDGFDAVRIVDGPGSVTTYRLPRDDERA